MFINVHYNTYTNKIHLWYDANGVTKHRSENWTPYVYRKNDEGDVKTIHGDNASRLNFNTYKSYKDFQTTHKTDIFENYCKPETQYLAEKYHHVEDDDIIPPKLKIYSIDIEVDASPKINPSKRIKVRKKI